MKEILENLSMSATNFVVKILIAFAIFVIGFRIIHYLEKILKKERKLTKLDTSARGFIISFIIVSLKIFVIIIILSIVGVPTASLVTILGSCAVAIGLALQGGLSNIAGGLMILIFKPFKVGDYISTDNLEGFVKSITMFYTTIVTMDNKVIQLPNGSLSNSNITNHFANKTRRVEIDVSVAYHTNIDELREIVNNIINHHKLVLQDKEKVFKLKTHGNSALIFTLRVWTKSENYWNLYFDLMEIIKKEFDNHGIEIPFNQIDVHMIK